MKAIDCLVYNKKITKQDMTLILDLSWAPSNNSIYSLCEDFKIHFFRIDKHGYVLMFKNKNKNKLMTFIEKVKIPWKYTYAHDWVKGNDSITLINVKADVFIDSNHVELRIYEY